MSIVVTPSIVLAGTAFHSNQKVRKDELTRIIPETRIKISISSKASKNDGFKADD